MILVPFFIREPISSLIPWKLQPITLFLENRGKQFCQVDDANGWLQENGFVVEKTWKDKDIFYVKVNTEKTNLKSFYSFEELTKQQQKGTEECWRTFFIMVSDEETDSCKSWNECIEQPFLNVLNAIQKNC